MKENAFRYYYRNCKRRGHEFDLTLEYMEKVWKLQNGICPYTKVNLKLNTHQKQHKDFRYSASLDRIDSEKGYVQGNVQFVSTAINYMKSTMTDVECKEFLKEISTNINP